MKTGFVKAFVMSCGALLAPQVLAQSSAQQRNAPSAAVPADAARTQTAAAGIKGAKPNAAAIVTAAGSIIVLADGIVANATLAQIAPPADGFVYER